LTHARLSLGDGCRQSGERSACSGLTGGNVRRRERARRNRATAQSSADLARPTDARRSTSRQCRETTSPRCPKSSQSVPGKLTEILCDVFEGLTQGELGWNSAETRPGVSNVTAPFRSGCFVSAARAGASVDRLRPARTRCRRIGYRADLVGVRPPARPIPDRADVRCDRSRALSAQRAISCGSPSSRPR
jgi:hypothetical protein